MWKSVDAHPAGYTKYYKITSKECGVHQLTIKQIEQIED